MISSKRKLELAQLTKRFSLGIGVVACLYIFPQLLQTVTFSVYIWFKGDIRLSDAFLILMVFRLLQDPMRTLPNFLGTFLAFMVSSKRI